MRVRRITVDVSHAACTDSSSLHAFPLVFGLLFGHLFFIVSSWWVVRVLKILEVVF
jgi:hypothetical protein